MSHDSDPAADAHTYLSGSALGPLTGDFGSPDAPDCLAYYNEPLMWLSRDPHGREILVQMIDDDGQARALLAAIPIRADQAAWLRAPETDLEAAVHLAVRAIADARADGHEMLLCTVAITDFSVRSERPARAAEVAAVTPDGHNDMPVPRLDDPAASEA